MKKLLLFSFIFFAVVNPAHAESCLGTYRSFMKSSQNERERNQEIRGAFQMNACQWNDYSSVTDQLETVKNQFKTKAAACDNSIEEQTTVHELIMERRFIREVVNKKADYPSGAEEDEVQKFLDDRISNLQKSFETTYVTDRNWLSSQELGDLFAGWKERYSERIPQYANCKEGPFVEVTNSWNKLKASIESLKALFAKKKTVDDLEADEPTTRHENEGEVKHFQVNPLNVQGDVYESLKAERVEAPLSLQDAVQASSSPRFDAVLDSLATGETERALQLESVDRLARYTLLYGTNGAALGTDLQNTVAQMNTLVQTMTTSDLPTIENQLQVIYGKQCN